MLSNERTSTNPLSNYNAPRPRSFDECFSLLGTERSVQIGHNTFIEGDSGSMYTRGIWFHRTQIVKHWADGRISLNSGGFRTATTKERINRYLPAGVSLFQKQREWYVRLPDGTRLDFEDNLTLNLNDYQEVK